MTNAQMVKKMDTTETRWLYIAFELSNKIWKLMFSDGNKRRQKSITARSLSEFTAELAKAKSHFGMDENVKIISCYEAGRDGFWIHRYLTSLGIENLVVDSSSIEVNRRFRQAKSDGIDVGKLLNMLMRHAGGEKKIWSVLRVPTVEQEDARRIDREIKRLKKERTAHTNRIRSLLVLHGLDLRVGPNFEKYLEKARMWDKSALPMRVKNEILREHKRFQTIQLQLKELENEQKEMLSANDKPAKQVRTLQALKGLGPVSSWRLVYDFFGWRRFNNVKEVGAAAGLTPTPYDSGDSNREQGISKAGSGNIRSVSVELAWCWVRYQPQSKLSLWFQERFAKGGKRMRRVGIVALARKLLVALWKYLETGLVPEGAIMKPVV